MTSIKRLALAILASAGMATAVQAATITNGGFELPGTFNGNYQSIDSGNAAALLPGWSVQGNIELINTHWQAADGDYSLDMNGTAAGAISQTITNLEIGKKYMISFALAGNPGGSNTLKSIEVSVGAITPLLYSFDTTSTSRDRMGWTTKKLSFIAADTETLLTFRSLESGPYGPALDDVWIAPIPIPAGMVLLLSALGALALRTRLG